MSLTRRSISQFIIGLSIISIGIGFVLVAKAGYGPWDIFFYHWVEIFDSTFLIVQSGISFTLLLISSIISKERWDKKYLVSALGITYISFWIDILIKLPTPATVVGQYALLVFGVFLIAVGINICRIADVALLPIEHLNNAIYRKTRFSFGRIKQFMEAGILLFTVAIAYYFDLTYKIGIGTIVIAFLGGQFVNWTYNTVHKFIH